MEVAGVEGRTQGAHVEGHHARAVRTVDEGFYAPPPQLRNQGSRIAHEGGRARDMIHHDEPRCRSDTGEERVVDVPGAGDRERHGNHGAHGARPFAVDPAGIQRGEVFVTPDQHLVTGAQAEGSEDRIDTVGRVGDENDRSRLRPDELLGVVQSGLEHLRQPPDQELHGCGLEFAGQCGPVFKHIYRACPEGSVVQVEDPGVERPHVPEATGSHRGGRRFDATGSRAR